jgi:hypothetical protein
MYIIRVCEHLNGSGYILYNSTRTNNTSQQRKLPFWARFLQPHLADSIAVEHKKRDSVMTVSDRKIYQQHNTETHIIKMHTHTRITILAMYLNIMRLTYGCVPVFVCVSVYLFPRVYISSICLTQFYCCFAVHWNKTPSSTRDC